MNDSPRSILEQKKDRRGVLALIGAGGAAAVAALLGRGNGARAATNDPLIIGQDNEQDSGDNTRLGGSVDWGGVFEVGNRSSEGSGIAILGKSYDPAGGYGPGSGVVGESSTGAGVFGEVFGESGSGIGVAGRSNRTGPPGDGEGSGIGVSGKSGSGDGVDGTSQSGVGVAGHSDSGIGVAGDSPSGTGVHGKSEIGPGVVGRSHFSPGVVGVALGHAPGVLAESRSGEEPYPLDGGLALEVMGKARFSTCGAYTVPRGDNSVFVPNPAVTDVSHITVTLTSNPGGLRVLQRVERMPGSGFRVHLTPALLRPATVFTYLIVEPGE